MGRKKIQKEIEPFEIDDFNSEESINKMKGKLGKGKSKSLTSLKEKKPKQKKPKEKKPDSAVVTPEPDFEPFHFNIKASLIKHSDEDIPDYLLAEIIERIKDFEGIPELKVKYSISLNSN